jgi:hypothetical protein
MLTVVANARRTTEFRVANDYTYRQVMHIMATYVRDKFLVVNEIVKSLGGKSSGDRPPARVRAPEKTSEKGHQAGSRSLPSWYQQKVRYDPRGRRIKQFNKVVDLDGPMRSLQPYLGKGKIRRVPPKKGK